ncbi:MAG: hypothetical protein E7173_03235 [Firmicutes bacterium]|nr:hypothetical protein [Bacillota bacterium]
MQDKNLKSIISILTTAKIENDFGEDNNKIGDLCILLKKFETEVPTIDELNKVEKDVLELEIKYDIFNELSYYFSPLSVKIKNKIHNEEVRRIREENRGILIMNENNLKDSEIRGKIDIAFARLIGPLAIMNELKSYESSQEEIRDLLDIITKWGAKFQSIQKLSFINPDEILNIYNRLDALKDKFLFDTNLGLESELSDEIVIWMYELMELRKIQIERESKK